MILILGLWAFLRALFTGAAVVALENLALRHQLAALQHSVPRPRLSRWDRILWVWLSRRWTGWRASLVIVQPATVLAWSPTRSCCTTARPTIKTVLCIRSLASLIRAAGIERDDAPQTKLDKLEPLLRQSSEHPAEDMPLFAALLSIPGGDRYPLPKSTVSSRMWTVYMPLRSSTV